MKKTLLLLTLFVTLSAFSVTPSLHAQDIDGDGVANIDDLDNDNDGILDADELGDSYTGITASDLGMTVPGSGISGLQSGSADISSLKGLPPGTVTVTYTNVRTSSNGQFNLGNPGGRVPGEIVITSNGLPIYLRFRHGGQIPGTGTREDNFRSENGNPFLFTGSLNAGFTNGFRSATNEYFVQKNTGSTDAGTIEWTSSFEPSFDISVNSTSTQTPNYVLQFLYPRDTDSDGISDHLDLDSDNDGVFDSFEAEGTTQTVDSNGRLTGGVDSDGVPTSAGGGFTLLNTDGTGGENPYDIDSDADGCSDANEYYNRPGADGGDQDGEFGTNTPAGVNGIGLVNGATYDGNLLANTTDAGESDACDLSLTDGSCWRTIAPSNDGYTYESFFASFNSQTPGGLWTQGITGSRGTNFGDANVYTMNGAGTDWVPVSNLGASMDGGVGVLISVFDDDNFDGTPDGFPKTSVGLFDIANQNEPQTRPLQINTTDGWNIVGNPFNSAVDFSDIGRSNVNNAAWVYDRTAPTDPSNNPGNTGWWRSTNDSGLGDLSDGIIHPGQGFVVQGNGNGRLVLDENDKVAVNGPTGDFYGKESKNVKTLPDHLRLEVRGEGIYNSAWIQLTAEGSASEITSSDVRQFYPFESGYAVLSTIKGGQLFDISHFPTPTNGDEMRIPLTLETTSTGPMTLELTDLQYNGSTLYLHDTETGESVELTEGATYSFTASGTPAKSRGDCYSTPMGFTGPQKAKQASPRFYISAEAALNSSPEVPNEYGLDQNYPNPFNPTTQITYQLPRQADVRLEVFDMAGRQVATLVNQNLSAGTHTVNFNATNLSSGVYMYRLQAGATVLTKKLTLIK